MKDDHDLLSVSFGNNRSGSSSQIVRQIRQLDQARQDFVVSQIIRSIQHVEPEKHDERDDQENNDFGELFAEGVKGFDFNDESNRFMMDTIFPDEMQRQP